MFDDDDVRHEPIKGRRKKAAKLTKLKKKAGTFEAMGLSVPLLRAIKRKGFQLPTPIQRKAIPPALQGLDVIGMARTGSGKTAAFVIPILSRLGAHLAGGARAVLLSPTRELALQTYHVVTELARHTDLRSAVLVGGDSMAAQFAELAAAPDILVATPGRLLHHLAEVPGFTLRSTAHVVLDEADRLFELGLEEQVHAILKAAGEPRQVLLFSATLPSRLADFAAAGLASPALIRLDVDTKLSPDLRPTFFALRRADKPAALLTLLREFLPPDSRSIVFAATKHAVDFLTALLEREGVPCAAAYGAMDQAARTISVGRFRHGRARALLVTDVAARGIDIPLVDNIVNYDFPTKPKLFVHRCGRAARSGRAGAAYSFVEREELPYLIDLHLFLSRPLRVVPPAGEGRVADASAASAAGGDANETWLGSVPDAVLDMAVESVAEAVARDPALQGAQSSAANGHALYVKTRPAASTESLRRARAMPAAGPHPVLLRFAAERRAGDCGAEAAQAGIKAALRDFRPAVTVLEAPVATSRRMANASKRAQSSRGPGGDVGGNEETAEVSVTQGCGHIAATDMALPESAGGMFRDESFFIPTQRSERHTDDGYAFERSARGQLASAVLDLGAEDNDGLAAAKRRRTAWDPKKKRYVQLQADEAIRAGKRVRVDTGKHAKENESSGELYKKWVGRVGGKSGEALGRGIAGGTSALGDRFKHAGRGWKNPLSAKVANSGVRNDVKDEGQLRKHAKKQDKSRQRRDVRVHASKARSKCPAKKGATGKGRRKG